MTAYRTFRAPVEGGELAGGVWNPDADGVPILAPHGITATHLSWPLIVERLPGTRFIAPDLRGRGRSNALPSPFGMPAQAEDMLRVLDHFEIDRAVVVGHSMGGFVSVLLAAMHPDRVSSLVLVDGGLPIAPPAGVAAQDAAAATLGPALTRLTMEFASREAYRQFWLAHPALGPYWNAEMAAYVDYDLDGVEPHLHSSADPNAIAENSLQMDGSDGYSEALHSLDLPIDFLRAPRGLLDAAPLYTPADVARETAGIPHIRTHEVQDVNHYTIVLSDRGADQVAPVISAQLVRATMPAGEGTL
ncbi:alpha/beta hydrolase [Glaciibacter flavus]|uniref:alpha/beta hydrolase n=1 Tax=Orlajensenia flava TaxID=2565934 RepID=UPI001F45BFF4|nr:alpha/beta hydrolase [Glaciibacter flavus]